MNLQPINPASSGENPLYEIIIKFTNGSTDSVFCPSFHEARVYCRENISYSSGRVARVEIRSEHGGILAIWDATWDDASKYTGLRK